MAGGAVWWQPRCHGLLGLCPAAARCSESGQLQARMDLPARWVGVVQSWVGLGWGGGALVTVAAVGREWQRHRA